MKKNETSPDQSVISQTPISGSKKVYVPGKLHDIQVAMREINLSPTKLANGGIEVNQPVTVYDTSGPYTDENITLDIKKGLPRIREQWILDRGDVEELGGTSSDFGTQRKNDETLDHLRFEHIRLPLKAKKGANVSQMYYAKKGIITPEMEYIAIRENQLTEQLKEQLHGKAATLLHQHEGHSFGANTPKNFITPEFVRDEVAAGRAIIPKTSITRKVNR